MQAPRCTPSLKVLFFFPLHVGNERLSFRQAMLTVQVSVFLHTGVIIDAAVLMERGECPWSVCPLSVMLLC